MVQTIEHTPATASFYNNSITETCFRQGTEGLKRRLDETLVTIGLADDELINRCIELCLELHEGQERTYEKYVNHPLRVTLRLIEEYDVTDQETICAALLHDTIEDQLQRIMNKVGRDVPADPYEALSAGSDALGEITTSKIGEYVSEVSGPIKISGETREEKNKRYADHTRQLVDKGSPAARAIKGADFTDNSEPNSKEDPGKRQQLDNKQALVYWTHIQGLQRPDSLVQGKQRIHAIKKMSLLALQAYARLGYFDNILVANTLSDA